MAKLDLGYYELELVLNEIVDIAGLSGDARDALVASCFELAQQSLED